MEYFYAFNVSIAKLAYLKIARMSKLLISDNAIINFFFTFLLLFSISKPLIYVIIVGNTFNVLGTVSKISDSGQGIDSGEPGL